MSLRWRGPLPWLAAAFAADVAVTVTAASFLSRGVVDQDELTALTLVSVAGAAALFALSWKIVDYLVVRSIRRMAAEVRAIAHGSTREGVDVERYGIVSPLPEAVNEVCARMIRARAELSAGLSAATAKADENAARLAAILNDLHEGVVVCNLRHQVVLYNQVAFDMLRDTADLGLGRSLFETVLREPVTHMLTFLTHRAELAGRGAPFLAGTVDQRMLLQARMTLIKGADGVASGYVVTLVDAGPQVAALASRDALLREVAEGLEAPLIRLRIAAGNPVIVERECGILAKAIKRVTEGYQRAISGWWPMTDLHSADLLSFVATRLDGVSVTVTGLPAWLHGDSHSLVLAIGSLVRHVAEGAGVTAFDLSAGGTGDEAWTDIRWQGEPVPQQQLERWLSQPMPVLGGMTARDVLHHHAGDALHHHHAEGWTTVRLPMRKGVERRGRNDAELPERPEFYDLSLLGQPQDTGAMGGQDLRALTYVVFDTETTGLQPSQGDRIVSIAGVRIVNGRILSGESFNRIVNPGRPIPPDSIRFHGITDDMARDRPPAAVVLPQFKAFASGAVLVAHNAAFDLKFLKLRERDCQVVFDNPVLDTMILSNYLDGPDAGHTLDAICERYGIEITDRHTALGDSMVTAAVLLRQIEALEARGIRTLDQAVKTLNITMLLHERQRVL